MTASDQGGQSSFTLSDGTTVSTADALIRWCEDHKKEGIQHLLAGDFKQWLTDLGRDDLAQVAVDAVAHGRDDEEKLSLFIGYSKVANYFQRSLERRFTFLLVGRTGVGKSSTINTLLGKEVAPVGDSEPVTSTVAPYDTDILGIPCRVVDTPGLADGKDLDVDYIAKMHAAVGTAGVDCVWFVTPIYETRVRTDELGAIKLITQAFGPGIWSRSLVVLSFADYLAAAPEGYQRQVTVRPVALRQAIADASGGNPPQPVGSDTAAGIPFVPVSNRELTTPDGAHWLGHLYVETLDRMSAAGFGPMFLALMERTEDLLRSAPGSGAAASSPIVIDQTLNIRYENVVSNKVYESTGYRPEPNLLKKVASTVKSVWNSAKSLGSKIFGRSKR
jgi:hypothetical protein